VSALHTLSIRATRHTVDRGAGGRYTPRLLRHRFGAAIAFVLGGCATAGGGSGPEPAGPPAIDPSLAPAIAQATALEAPLQILFDWTFEEGSARFNGRGVTRVAPPEHARLDLFGPRGEGYLSAALVGMELRLPPGADNAPLPPPELLWTVLGVFRAPEAATLTLARREGTETRLQYTRGDERWSFRFEGDVLRSAEWVGPGQGRRTVELTGDGDNGLPGVAVYRDWIAFRELRVTLQEVSRVDGFPSDTWIVGGG